MPMQFPQHILEHFQDVVRAIRIYFKVKSYKDLANQIAIYIYENDANKILCLLILVLL